MTSELSNPKSFLVLAVDGGAASGKSSTSKILAGQLHLLHVDTGSHYRAVTLAALRAGVPPTDGRSLRQFLAQLELDTHLVDRESQIVINNESIPSEDELRSEEINRNVSLYAAQPAVREAVKAYQRGQLEVARINGFNGVVMDGRDIGTVILPEADLKVFLVADPSTREQRRVHEGGVDAIADRDKTDSSRSTAPLRPAEDAVIIDNSNLSLEEVVREIRDLIQHQ